MLNHSWTTTFLNDTRLLTPQELAFYSRPGDVSLNIRSWSNCGRLCNIPRGAGYSASHKLMAIPVSRCREFHGQLTFIISRPSNSIEPKLVGSLRTLHDLHLPAKLAINQPRSCLIQGPLVLPILIRNAVGVSVFK